MFLTAPVQAATVVLYHLLDGGYAALDNFRIAASDTPGDVGDGATVPEPTCLLSLLALVALGAG